MKTGIVALLLTGCFISCEGASDKSSDKTENKLEIPSGGLEFQLVQRHERELPSELGKASCSIGDITGGQTWLTIQSDTIIVFEKSIHEHDTLSFKFGGEKFKITCLEMINELIGDDLATLKIFKD